VLHIFPIDSHQISEFYNEEVLVTFQTYKFCQLMDVTEGVK